MQNGQQNRLKLMFRMISMWHSKYNFVTLFAVLH